MEFKGIVTHIFEPKSGISSAGKEWKNQEFRVEEYGQQYPNSVVVSVFNDKVQIPPINTFVTVHINSSSREYNGKYYNSLQAWKVDTPNGAAQQAPAPQSQPPATFGGMINQFPQQPQQPAQEAQEDDLPF